MRYHWYKRYRRNNRDIRPVRSSSWNLQQVSRISGVGIEDFPPEVLVFGKQRQVPASITSDLKVSAHMLAESSCAEGIRFRQELEVKGAC